jgi:cytochrome P450
VQITPDVRLAACSADPAVAYRAAASGAVGGLRVVGGGAEAEEILGSDAWLVVPPSVADPRSEALLAKTARFSEGREHRERRAAAQALMPDPARARETARLLTGHAIADAGPFLDAMPVARQVPVAALACCLGIPGDASDRVASLVGQLCDASAPRLLPHLPGDGLGEAADELAAASAAACGSLAAGEAAVGLMFQARDATAGLVGSALLRAGDPDLPERAVEEALRRDCPVQATTRARAGTADPPALAWIVLATGDATLDIAPTFGRGRHACPGHAVAAALAAGVVAAFGEAGWQAVQGQSIGYEPRPNLRIPHQVLLAKETVTRGDSEDPRPGLPPAAHRSRPLRQRNRTFHKDQNLQPERTVVPA